MKIIIKKQFDKSGEEYLDEEEIEIEINKEDDEILLETGKELLIIPLEAFIGIFNQ